MMLFSGNRGKLSSVFIGFLLYTAGFGIYETDCPVSEERPVMTEVTYDHWLTVGYPSGACASLLLSKEAIFDFFANIAYLDEFIELTRLTEMFVDQMLLYKDELQHWWTSQSDMTYGTVCTVAAPPWIILLVVITYKFKRLRSSRSTRHKCFGTGIMSNEPERFMTTRSRGWVETLKTHRHRVQSDSSLIDKYQLLKLNDEKFMAVTDQLKKQPG